MKNNGFTLIEVIISIVILSIAGAIVLQLFVAADRMSKNSRELEMASLAAANGIEVIKSSASLQEVIKDSFFEDAKAEETKDGLSILLFYDDTFRASSSEQAYYKLELMLTLDTSNLDGQLFQVTSEVIKLSEAESLVSYETGKYFEEGRDQQ